MKTKNNSQFCSERIAIMHVLLEYILTNCWLVLLIITLEVQSPL